MGCYGIGISRIVTAVVEEHHDDARHRVAGRRSRRTTCTSSRSPARATPPPRSCAAADELYDAARRRGRRGALRRPRRVSPGVKFADADLLGMPVRLTLGAKGLARGIVERQRRARPASRTSCRSTTSLRRRWSGPRRPAELRRAASSASRGTPRGRSRAAAASPAWRPAPRTASGIISLTMTTIMAPAAIDWMIAMRSASARCSSP